MEAPPREEYTSSLQPERGESAKEGLSPMEPPIARPRKAYAVPVRAMYSLTRGCGESADRCKPCARLRDDEVAVHEPAPSDLRCWLRFLELLEMCDVPWPRWRDCTSSLRRRWCSTQRAWRAYTSYYDRTDSTAKVETRAASGSIGPLSRKDMPSDLLSVMRDRRAQGLPMQCRGPEIVCAAEWLCDEIAQKQSLDNGREAASRYSPRFGRELRLELPSRGPRVIRSISVDYDIGGKDAFGRTKGHVAIVACLLEGRVCGIGFKSLDSLGPVAPDEDGLAVPSGRVRVHVRGDGDGADDGGGIRFTVDIDASRVPHLATEWMELVIYAYVVSEIPPLPSPSLSPPSPFPSPSRSPSSRLTEAPLSRPPYHADPTDAGIDPSPLRWAIDPSRVSVKTHVSTYVLPSSWTTWLLSQRWLAGDSRDDVTDDAATERSWCPCALEAVQEVPSLHYGDGRPTAESLRRAVSCTLEYVFHWLVSGCRVLACRSSLSGNPLLTPASGEGGCRYSSCGGAGAGGGGGRGGRGGGAGGCRGLYVCIDHDGEDKDDCDEDRECEGCYVDEDRECASLSDHIDAWHNSDGDASGGAHVPSKFLQLTESRLATSRLDRWVRSRTGSDDRGWGRHDLRRIARPRGVLAGMMGAPCRARTLSASWGSGSDSDNDDDTDSESDDDRESDDHDGYGCGCGGPRSVRISAHPSRDLGAEEGALREGDAACVSSAACCGEKRQPCAKQPGEEATGGGDGSQQHVVHRGSDATALAATECHPDEARCDPHGECHSADVEGPPEGGRRTPVVCDWDSLPESAFHFTYAGQVFDLRGGTNPEGWGDVLYLRPEEKMLVHLH